MTANPIVVEAWRGAVVESQHRGAVAIVDADGALHTAVGDVDRAVFPRSAVKVLQALPLVADGAADRYALTDAELALACASHGGEPGHVATAAAMLAKTGLDAAALECGVHWPKDEAAARALAAAGGTPSALHNNCSGKHAGLVCVACALAERANADPRAFVRGYVDREHPTMRAVEASIQAASGWDLANTPVGIDGCSIPTYAIPLRHLALAFARVGTGVGLDADRARAARRLRAAVAAEPWRVAGTDRFDTDVMQRFGERVFCKVGAEGVHCAALPGLGVGVAVKVDDGNNSRACEVVLAAVLGRLLALDDADASWLAARADVTLRNWRGRVVGRLAATPLLTDALA